MDGTALSEDQRRVRLKQVVYLIALSAFAPLLALPITKTKSPIRAEGTHPLYAVRAISIANYVLDSALESRIEAQEIGLRDMVMEALVDAATVSVTATKLLIKEFEERAQREGEVAALRAVCIRKLFYDEGLASYIGVLQERLKALRSVLKPRGQC